jgi:uroporphyrin-III C-methyltransferase
VAGSAGIAVTQRGVSRSFWVITATTDLGTLNPDLLLAVHTDATIVVLMGLSKLAEIAAEFVLAGKANLPVAVIQDGTLPTQKIVTGTIEDIAAKTKAAGLKSPAILVFGDVVRQGLLQTIDYKTLTLLHAA